mgnify:CR=1 FL=1
MVCNHGTISPMLGQGNARHIYGFKTCMHNMELLEEGEGIMCQT